MSNEEPARMPADDRQLVWGAYIRMSRVRPRRKRGRPHGPDESTGRQRALIKAHAAKRGLNLPDHLIFEDNGRSSWQKPGGPPPHRPEWDQMIKLGKAGMFQGLLTWKIDRFARNPRDGEDLVDLTLVLDGPECSRMDLRKAADLSNFRTQVEAASNYSHEISEKVRAAFEDMLAHGYRIGGSGRMFGFKLLSDEQIEVDWDAVDPDVRFVGPAGVVEPEEAAVVRHWAAMLLVGETAETRAAYANERGFLTARGGEWTGRSVDRTLGNPIYGGYLAYKGEVVGALANVEPILDEQTYNDVQAALGARRQGAKPRGLHLLTGMLHCANPECQRQGTMAGFIRWETGERRYVCQRRGAVPGCGMTVSAPPVDAIVRDKVVALTSDPGRQEAMAAADSWLDEEREKLAGLLEDRDIAETEAKAARVPRSQTRTRAQYERNVDHMQQRYRDAEEKLAGLGKPSRRKPKMPPVTAAEWDHPEATTPAERAEIIRRLDLRVSIKPDPRGRGKWRKFDPSRVVIEEV
jgi:DNA invertase Pin-like site-specific DNA recombinase